jgi:primosomal protein N' (replication factor Y) (superfamily II helicase)
MYASVALPFPQSDYFTYRVTDRLASSVSPGMLAVVPFRNIASVGVILDLFERSDLPERNIREIIGLGDPELSVSGDILKLIQYVAQQYITTPGMALKAALPPGTMQSRKLYFYPGVTSDTNLKDTIFINFLAQVADEPGRWTYADLKRFGDIGRKDIDELLRSGILTVSPFRITDTLSHRGQERWIIAAADASSHSLRKGSKSEQLLTALLTSPNGLLTSSLTDLGFSSAVAGGLVKKGLAEYIYRPKRIGELGSMKSLPEEKDFELTLWQQSTLKRIQESLVGGKYKGFLLYGVTSSGKTQVYLEAARHALALGKSVLVLVPEISLTPQIISRFERFLNVAPLVWHSHLTSTERLTIFKEAKSGESKILIGTRSAIFSPLKNLGLIVVDEEQDHSYKQDDPAPRYNARDLSRERGKISGATVLFGSATPSVESFYLSKTGELEFLTLPQRVAGIGRPEINIISTAFRPEPKPNEAPIFPRGFRPISEKLYEEITIKLKKHEQVIILLNRRGYSSAVVCFECGWVGKCPDCEIGWTYHKIRDRMICHYCGREQRGPVNCAQCGSTHLSFRSAGTQRLEETLMKILPKSKVVRLDTDVAVGKWKTRDILDDFGKGKYQILLGTQMVAKGHHFPRVTMVGVISSDIGLSLPDFRATERVLALLTQAAGRAGRSSKKGDSGLVMIQTFSPENPVYGYLKSNNFLGFLEDELKIRQSLGYPPYKRLALVVISSTDTLRAQIGANDIKAELRVGREEIEVLGPVESPIFKRGKLYRYQLLIKFPPELAPAELLSGVSDFMKRSKGVFVRIDVDPVSFM